MASKGPPFLRYDPGALIRGDIVEVTLTRGANVELLDLTTFNKFQRGMAHQYYGGLAKRSPSPCSGIHCGRQGLRGLTTSALGNPGVTPSRTCALVYKTAAT